MANKVRERTRPVVQGALRSSWCAKGSRSSRRRKLAASTALKTSRWARRSSSRKTRVAGPARRVMLATCVFGPTTLGLVGLYGSLALGNPPTPTDIDAWEGAKPKDCWDYYSCLDFLSVPASGADLDYVHSTTGGSQRCLKTKRRRPQASHSVRTRRARGTRFPRLVSRTTADAPGLSAFVSSPSQKD